MEKRSAITPSTLESFASQIAGLRITQDVAKGHAEALEPIMEAIASLRDLPLKEIEPALIFAPEEE